MADTAMVRIEKLDKTFVLHVQNGVRLDVLSALDFAAQPGECIVLDGPSGSGKSTLLRCLYGNYRASGGRILIRHDGRLVDIAAAEPRAILDIRRRTLGYVSQFLRVVPRVATLELVAEPLRGLGVRADEASERAAALLERLNLPRRLWPLAPATFSGGEQQRVNIARGFIVDYPVMLMDEPTAALDTANRDAVAGLIRERVATGTSVIGIFHDPSDRDRVATRVFAMAREKAAA